MTDDQKQMEQMANDIREIKLAVLGDEKVGLNGLVNDMASIKEWRNSISIKVAVISGLVSGAVLGAKALLARVFGSA